MNPKTDMEDSVGADVRNFIGIVRGIINQRSEDYSEIFVATHLDSEHPDREEIKKQYKEMFGDLVVNML